MTHRLALGAALALALAGCEEDKAHEGTVTAERSQAVQSQGSQNTAATVTASAVAPAPHAAPKAHRALCGGHLDAEGKAVPKKAIGRNAAPGAPELPAEPSFGGFTWVNFWAAWCVPCREEIPRLLGFEQKLAAQGKKFHVMFVSLDDDERQLAAFLGSQPPGGLRSTYWLREGKERVDWLSGAGVDPDPDLPQHLLVDDRGKVRCRVRGAVDDADFDTLAGLLAQAGN